MSWREVFLERLDGPLLGAEIYIWGRADRESTPSDLKREVMYQMVKLARAIRRKERGDKATREEMRLADALDGDDIDFIVSVAPPVIKREMERFGFAV